MKNHYGAVTLENSELHEHCVNRLSLLKITGCIRVMCFLRAKAATAFSAS